MDSLTEAKKPPFFRFFGPFIQVLVKLGGSATRKEVFNEIAILTNLTEDELSETLKNGQSKIENLVHWAEIYLVKSGYIDSSQKGILSLTEKANKIEFSDDVFLNLYIAVRQDFSDLSRKSLKEKSKRNIIPKEEILEISNYGVKLLQILKTLPPTGFERICARLLRESGFEEVIITGKTADGGIDGTCILEVNPLLSFKVIFQCKRYKETVSADKIRDFRGAMQGRADKAIFITTGRFTAEAIKEASRDGVPQINLVDGSELVTLFEKNLMGLKQITGYKIDESFFDEYYNNEPKVQTPG